MRSDEGRRAVGLADDVVLTGFPDDHPGFPGGAGFSADRPTVARAEPDWPMSDERLSLLINLGVAAAIAVLLALRRLGRWVLQRRSAR